MLQWLGSTRGAELGGVAELGRPEVRDGADSRGPLDRETREKRPARKARTKRESVLLQRRHRCTGWMGQRGGGRPAGPARPAGLAGPKAEWAARSAGPKARKKNF
jgi:hypothetical protein